MNGSAIAYSEDIGSVVRQNEDMLLRVARCITRDRESAKDALQDAVLSVLTSKGSFTGAASLKTYLYRTVVNKCIDTNRRNARWRTLLFFMRPEDLSPGAVPVPESASQGMVIKDFINRLPDKIRIPFILAECEELPYQEISEILQVPLNTVRTRIFRAREKLRGLALKRGILP
ncbi:MAG: hypothetical protein A2268_06135 [Candidatus Raymondbacteria bacterium RifOxyA12_full_50_37]|uniref:RNA polymerase subunit sigma-24 n=1 Tax=Candidatus Raymondbacteria bacterium RIFOXYD12_FULL_49_13 TaxID=1817890 RepID=A0A1F7FK64_UNCRA|nr:MAG: hypothetical protein A2268_06135 [Candidatus Raymondbacteria bacterium RifOxyA12_full_50_37]OGJ94547.1 MAG: hypothetical protein A2248_15065 [Candidatus Raymondbacteria bacterium RIFOXYA2_FULL_49_16]OGJ98503.1 MAG: hypothetical protein A2487_05400 [Candidatus Raymondbacteria bacterium RifOxyC12_full_50_8]OGK01696.1 MAG: hypothetical protein A2350_10795 [Candidatus Raymondbacteria bacterium RifOxyB12_full_50_8]OGK07023.1 MAG: hypothetical protein A2519_13705 [Candidatus Raymondbacteria b